MAIGYGQLLRKAMADTADLSSRYGVAIIATILVFALIAKSKE
jgi:hypothetical protein